MEGTRKQPAETCAASIRVAEKIGMTYERMIEWEGEPAKLYVAQLETGNQLPSVSEQ
jgi:hypothetical protein